MWHLTKSLIIDMTGLSDQVLHLLVGSALYLCLALTLRRPVLAFCIVLTLQLTNEAVDLLENLNGAGLSGALEDTALTLIPAVAIALLLSELQKALFKPA